MWTLAEFQDHLLEEYGYDVWEEKISEGLKNVVINTLESVQDAFDNNNGQ